ncbi:hypothetical protein PCIT_a0067 [Pseudoalteromonas citrea]|uniref:Uncharacterized protein n=2 Tax=Pseudoalteromonas citrea TaxID=43655 RepID=A0AAD4AK78_9GAMM|nr:hypothetical protein [Pseudoalteromonas citrea]KAF7773751.1 hypothetical protein PCIT_a0067 [Pseudoalteromonas citrea]
MWFHKKDSVQEAYRFIKFLTKKKSISDHRIDTESLIQETLLKVIKATQRELTLDTNTASEDRLSIQNEFNHLLKAYTYRAFECVYLDMCNNVTFRRKSPGELANSSDENSSVQLVHVYDSHNTEHSSNIFEMLPTPQATPLQGTRIDKNASQFINLLLETIGQEKDQRKQALFFDFFSLSFRQSGQTQKQLGQLHGFQGNIAITHISRFVNKLSHRVKESELDLELHSSNLASLDIYFLNHSNKLNETISV